MREFAGARTVPTIAARPEYALRLANTGLWDAATGRHALTSPITISGSSGGGTTTPGTLRRVVKLTINGATRVIKLV